MKLYYLDHKVRGEPIRLLLDHAKIPFQDIIISRYEWYTKFKSFEKFPFQQVPILELENGEILSQSTAILYYLGLKHGYLSMDPDLHYNCINLVNAIFDHFFLWAPAFHSSAFNDFDQDEIERRKKKYLETDLPVLLKALENHLLKNSSKEYLVGSSLSLADIMYRTVLNILESPEVENVYRENLSKLKYLPLYTEINKKLFEKYYTARNNKYKVIYFDAPGRAEAIRMIFKYCGVKFEDQRLTKEEWSKLKNELPLEYHQLPALVENEKYYVQSQAILEKLGIKFNLFPISDPLEMSDAITILGAVNDLFDLTIPFIQEGCKEEEKKQARNHYVNEKLPLYFSKFEKRLKEKECHTFILGSNITIADFALIGFFQAIVFNSKGIENNIEFIKILENYPILKNYIDKRLKDLEPIIQVSPSDQSLPPHSGLHHPGLSHPGLSHPGPSHPGLSHPGPSHPGLSHPGPSHPGISHPGMPHPETTHPAQGHPGHIPKK